MAAGRVSTLVIVGGNPVFNAPADLAFGKAMEKVGLRIHLGLYDDETSRLCHWHVAEAHPLESWSDARADDGTVTILQPLIAPLFSGRTAHELLAAFSAEPERTAHDIVKDSWHGQAARRPTSRPRGGRRSTTASSKAPLRRCGRRDAEDASRSTRPRRPPPRTRP